MVKSGLKIHFRVYDICGIWSYNKLLFRAAFFLITKVNLFSSKFLYQYFLNVFQHFSLGYAADDLRIIE